MASLLLLAGLVVLVGMRRPSSKEVLLPNGNLFSVAKVTYGKQHEFAVHPSVLHRFKRFIPIRFHRALKLDASVTHNTPTNTLVAWLAEKVPNGVWISPTYGTCVLRDEHGCEFFYGGKMSSGAGGQMVGILALEAYPRRPPDFQMQFHRASGAGSSPDAFTIQNPAPARNTPAWIPHALPITQKDGNLTARLTQFSLSPAGPGRLFHPTFEILLDGQPTHAWDDWVVTGEDATGNSTSYYANLCRQEPAWKLKVQFFRSPTGRFATNEIWMLPGIRVPAPGFFTRLAASNQLNGALLEALALAGAGSVNYSNGIPVSSSPGSGGVSVSSSTDMSGTRTMSVSQPNPSIAFKASGLDSQHRLAIRLVDNLGREFIADAGESGGVMCGSAKSSCPLMRKQWAFFSSSTRAVRSSFWSNPRRAEIIPRTIPCRVPSWTWRAAFFPSASSFAASG